jgi:hypothetical protein
LFSFSLPFLPLSFSPFLSFQQQQGYGGRVSSPEGYLLALWAHECQRVFADKLISLEDKGWVAATVAELAKQVCLGAGVWCGHVSCKK